MFNKYFVNYDEEFLSICVTIYLLSIKNLIFEFNVNKVISDFNKLIRFHDLKQCKLLISFFFIHIEITGL